MSRPPKPDHPAPHRERVETWEAWAALCAPPIAWAVQFAASSAYSSDGCFAAYGSLRAVGGLNLTFPLILTVLMLIVALGAVALSWALVRRTKDETGKSHRHLLETGKGRTHFMARWALYIGIGFTLAILINLILAGTLPSCG